MLGFDDGVQSDGSATILDPHEFWKEFFQVKFGTEVRRFIRRYPTETSLNIPVKSVIEFGENGILYGERLVKEPERTLTEIREAIEMFKLVQKKGENIPVHIRFINFERKTTVRDLRGPLHVGTFISVEGSIRKTASRKERLTVGVFRCKSGHRTVKRQPYALKEIPTDCSMDGCRSKSFELLEGASTFIDSQKALLQEYFELVNPGSQPETIEIELTEDLIDTLYAGNRVIINGILKRYQAGASKNSTIYKNYIEVNSVEVTEKEYAEISITEEDEEEIRQLASDPEIYQRLTNSIVPSIFGLENIKRAAMYAFFGGTVTEMVNGVRTRGDIHILLIGEPGIAKTDFMRKVMAYSPRGVYTSGKGSSGVGLVASVTKDEFGDGSYSLEAGAMALADMGMCIIDEINQIEKKDLSLLFEALESQQASIHKANIHTTIPTRCSVIAAANPKFGWIDDAIPLKEQIDLPGPFLQRFDLIYLLRDTIDTEKDNRIVRHIISNRSGTVNDKHVPDIPEIQFRKFVAFAKQQPLKWTKPAEDAIVTYYSNIRSSAKRVQNGQSNKPVPITPRQINSLARLSEGSARIRLSPKVDVVDVERGIEVLDECLREIGYDPETGVFDAGTYTTGENKKQTDVGRQILTIATDIADEKGHAKVDLILSSFKDEKVRYKAERMVDEMIRAGKLLNPRTGFVKVIS